MSVGWGQDCVEGDINWFEDLDCEQDWTILCESFDLDGDGQFSDGELYIDVNENGFYDLGEVELWGVCYNIEETTELNLYNSGLTGEIPPEIGNLTNLTSLNLGSNQLTGEIPVEIGNLTNLTYLNLFNNQLTGQIPSEIGNLFNLESLWLSENQISGEIPDTIWNLNNLIFLGLTPNEISGEISNEIGNLINLYVLKLSGSQINGEIPESIGNLTNLQGLLLNNNQLNGTVPYSICNLNISFGNPNSINIQNNQLCPPYPECIEDYVGYQDTSECEDVCLGIIGDITGDGFINVFDLVSIVNIILSGGGLLYLW